MLGWVKNPLTHREKQYIKEQKYYNEYSNTTDLNFKIAHKGEYIDLIINIDGLCNVRNMHGEIDDSIIKQETIIIDTQSTDSVKGILEETNLSRLFFSPQNIEAIQGMIRYYVYKLTGGQIVSNQSQDEIFIVM